MAENKTQRALIVQPDWSLKVEQISIPTIGDNEILVKVEAAAINPSDVLFVAGKYLLKLQPPFPTGAEGSGTIVELGKSYNGRYKVGDKVCVLRVDGVNGTWSEYMALTEARVFPMNPELTFEEAASHFVNPGTAVMMLRQVQKEGHKAVIHSAGASALGKMLIKLFKEEGIKTINLVRRDDVKEELKNLGADHVINIKDANFETELSEAIKAENATKFYDAVGGELTATVLRLMPDDSYVNIYGLLSGDRKLHMASSELFTGKKVSGFWLVHELSKLTPEQKWKEIQYVQSKLKTTLSSDIYKTFSLEEATEALESSEKNASKGKSIFKISQ